MPHIIGQQLHIDIKVASDWLLLYASLQNDWLLKQRFVTSKQRNVSEGWSNTIRTNNSSLTADNKNAFTLYRHEAHLQVLSKIDRDLVLLIYLLYCLTPPISIWYTLPKVSAKQKKTKQFTIISTDEDPGLRIESFAVINLRGVSTNKTIICFIAMETYKELKRKLITYTLNLNVTGLK
jgi:hypothetical protein